MPVSASSCHQPTGHQETVPLDALNSVAASAEQARHQHRLSTYCGRAITLLDNGRTAKRDDKEYENSLVFSAAPLQPDETFEIRIEAISQRWAGSLSIGLALFLSPTVCLSWNSWIGF